MKLLTTTRITMSTPSVMIAITKTGLPTIGRSASRSTPSATSAVSDGRHATAR